MAKRYKNYKISEHKSAVIIIFLLAVALGLLLLLHGTNIALLNPKGMIAAEELKLIGIAVGLMLIVAIPMLAMGFGFARKYREQNNSKHSPVWDSPVLAASLWIIPASVITILAFVTWRGTHALDPYKKLDAQTHPITIQVVALQWKWLFIYPEQNIATVNFVEFPVRTPINFELTADAPMNSFWIPNLGGQIYAMSGMKTHLNLIADTAGEFPGSAAEISGAGFAGMKFIAKSASQEEFTEWVEHVKQSQQGLDFAEYEKLAGPSENTPQTFYAATEYKLFDQIIAKYMPKVLHQPGMEM